MVPVSLLATVQLVRMFRANAIKADKQLFSGEYGRNPQVHNSQLNEVLGKVQSPISIIIFFSSTCHYVNAQVKYVFADKTGTVTKNRLSFKKCWVPSQWSRNDSGMELTTENPSSDALRSRILDMMSRCQRPRGSVGVCQECNDEDVNNNTNVDCVGAVRDLLLAVCLCHSVIPHVDENGKEYEVRMGICF